MFSDDGFVTDEFVVDTLHDVMKEIRKGGVVKVKPINKNLHARFSNIEI